MYSTPYYLYKNCGTAYLFIHVKKRHIIMEIIEGCSENMKSFYLMTLTRVSLAFVAL